MRVELVREMGAGDAARRRRAVLRRAAADSGRQRQLRVERGRAAAPQRGAAPPAAPQPGAQLERMLALWATPQGFVKAAMANNATTQKAHGGTEVSFTVGGKYKMTGTINAQGQVEKVQTWIDQPIVGDMLVETTYSGYKDFGGVMFPSRIVQTQDGYPVARPDDLRGDGEPGRRHRRARQRPQRSQPPPVRVDVAEAGRRRLLPDGRHAPQPRRSR